MGASSYGSGGYEDPVRGFVRRSYKPPSQTVVQRYVNLLSAGIARAPVYDRNVMLASLFRQDGPAFANPHIAEAVMKWLCTGRVMPVPATSFSRYQLNHKRGAHWVYETYSPATLPADAKRRFPPLVPILVEGSPDVPYVKTVRSLSAVRRTHHFVLLQFGGGLYVIDGARGMVFESLAAYLDTVMLPGHWGESSVRMKWFRIFDGGHEVDRSIMAQDSWDQPAM